ncbi:MAG TPA: hypothetical protein VN682_27955 [Terriglobales bacterium]|nr:hypothetical protein [Terriglobales bacterium]
MRTWLHPANWIAAVLLIAASNSYAAPGGCTNKWAAYDGYTIIHVELKNPIGFITPWGSLSTSLKKGLKLKVNAPFSHESFEQDSAFLSSTLKSDFAYSHQTVKLSYAGGEILDCDPEARTLRVVYPIFTSVVPSFIPPSIEEQTSELQHPATTGATRVSKRSLLIAPTAGYNQTRGTWGGLSFSDTIGKLRLQGKSEASGNSWSGSFDVGGNKSPVGNLWDHADWAGTFEYLNVPAGAARFKEGKVTGRFSASTKESAKKHIIIRYGAALEGGHEQSSNTLSDPKLIPNSGYGSLKLYVGVTGRPGIAAFTASYGFQLGSTFIDAIPVFKKHLLDLGYNVSVPVPFRKPLGDAEDFKGPLSASVHRSFNLETRLTAGLIQDASGAPLAEQFLGGNAIRPFVQDSSWLIVSNAFIRSIPENQLGAQSGTELGGSRFYSANATVSFTLWGKPMLPKELATADPRFPGILNAPFHTAALSLANTYKVKDPEYIRLSALVSAKAVDLNKKLIALSDELKLIPAAIAAEPTVALCLKDIKRNLLSTRGAANMIASQPDPQVVGQLVTDSLPSLSGFIQDLTKNLRDAAQADLATQIDLSMSDIKTLGNDIRDIDDLPSQKYIDQAWQTLAPGHRAIDVFLHDLNIYSVSPVGMFDVARVWPVSEGVQYGLGPGLRLSLVNANFTIGYGFNPQRSDRGNIGAIFFKLEITSLF